MLPEDCEYSIYCDANFTLKAQPCQIIAENLWDGFDWAAHRHPCRDCIYAEADVILNHPTMEGWRNQNPKRAPVIQAEIERYRQQDFPFGAGLWANGMIVRRHTAAVARLNERWWKLYSEGGERDQLSFPVARCAEGLAVKTIDHPINDGPYLNFYFHAAWKDDKANREYHPERGRIRERLEKLKSVTGSDGGIRYPEY